MADTLDVEATGAPNIALTLASGAARDLDLQEGARVGALRLLREENELMHAARQPRADVDQFTVSMRKERARLSKVAQTRVKHAC